MSRDYAAGVRSGQTPCPNERSPRHAIRGGWQLSRVNVLLVAIAATFLAEGIAAPYVRYRGQPFYERDIVESLLVAVLAYMWCKAHAASRRIVAPAGSALLAALLPPLGVPLYFFRSMPWRAALAATTKSLGYTALLVVLFWIGLHVPGFFAA